MVVEDEPDIYEVLLAMFGIWGIEGVAFVDGEEAVAWISDVDNKRFQGELPELALLDIRLPGEINGPAVGERLRKSGVLGDIAIVLTTAYKLTPNEETAMIKQAGADRLIYKPLPKFSELQVILESTIAERHVAKAKADAAEVKDAETSPPDDAEKVDKKPDKTDKASETQSEKQSETESETESETQSKTESETTSETQSETQK